MPAFSAHDGTELAYHVFGNGAPVVCLPGGPMQVSVYLGDLGGLSAHRCDRLVDDVEALREHLGLERTDLLAHSGGANLAALYACRHPEHVGKLALISTRTPPVRRSHRSGRR